MLLRIAKWILNKCLGSRPKKTNEIDQVPKLSTITQLSSLSSSPDTRIKTQKPIYQLTTLPESEYDSQAVIDFHSRDNTFSVQAHNLIKKWRNTRNTHCISIFADDLLENRYELENYFASRPLLTRIYLAGHCWIGSDFLSSDSGKNIGYTDIARGLVLFNRRNLDAVINITACCAGAGFKPDHSDSFAAKLHLELFKLSGKNFDVVARTSLVYVGPHKTTLAIDKFDKIKNLSFNSMFDRAISGPNKERILAQDHSKVTYRMKPGTQIQVRIDSYEEGAKKAKEKQIEKRETLPARRRCTV